VYSLSFFLSFVVVVVVIRARASVVHARVACVRTRVRIDGSTGTSPRDGPRAPPAHATGASRWVSRRRVNHECSDASSFADAFADADKGSRARRPDRGGEIIVSHRTGARDEW